MKSFSFIIFLIVFVLASSPKGYGKGLLQSLPGQVGEWQVRDEDERYNRNTLFEYINGGAELYLAYDFQQAFVRRYAGPDKSEIILDIYDMGNSADAFGVFSIERQDEDVGIGRGSEYGGGLLRFWQDRFFISILTTGDEKVAKAAMFRLAQDVARSIDKPGGKPDLIEALPREGLHPTSLRFFHTASILNRQYFLAEKNILNLDKDTQCVLAKYQQEDRSAYVLLVQYPSNASAKKARQNFIASYVPEAKMSGMAQVENKTWVLAKIRKNYLILVLEATRKEYGMDLLDGVKP